MKKYKAISIDASPSNEEGLAFVYFDFGNFNYLTLCFSSEEQEEIYIENSEQTQSVYSDNIEYEFKENELIFKFEDVIAQKINTDSVVAIHLNISQQQMNTLKESLNAIFEHKTVTTV